MRTAVRTLAQVVAESDAAPPDARCFFYDEARLRASIRNHDQVLYRAVRDACPPRTVTAADGSRHTWRLDRVAYPGEELPTGELGRSVGHWNPPSQSEIFEVDQGEIAVLTALDAGGPVELIRCPEGTGVCLKQGSWHLTYVLRGPAVVTNLYTEVARSRTGKYFSGPTVRVGLHRSVGEIDTFTSQPSPTIAWRLASDSRDTIGDFGALEVLLTSPTIPDILKNPQLHCRTRAPARPGGAGQPSRE
jgi:hypothetical protein